jgi:hypothetical protein
MSRCPIEESLIVAGLEKLAPPFVETRWLRDILLMSRLSSSAEEGSLAQIQTETLPVF